MLLGQGIRIIRSWMGGRKSSTKNILVVGILNGCFSFPFFDEMKTFLKEFDMVILSPIGIKVTNVTHTRYSDQIFLLVEMVKFPSKTYKEICLSAQL